MSFQNDYNLGKENETIILDVLNKHFNDNIKQSKNQMAKSDYYGDKANYELTTRRNKHNTYPTTLRSLHKINNEKEFYLIFSFTDGNYYIKYNEEQFNKYEIKPFLRNPRDGHNDFKRKHIFIPIIDLIKFV